ncbi:MAG: flagellar biosynthesis protein FlhB [Clostridiales bacterium]|jgi:flagellar biosynthetic protein FlhB|nr:flagellar biosynthesis protein FlhB [Clostridiales bacterium]
MSQWDAVHDDFLRETCRTDGARTLRLDLRHFAQDGPGGEKTETATAKKRQDARKKGQVMKSAEVITAVILLVAFFAIKLFGSLIYERIVIFTRLLFSDYMLAGTPGFSTNGMYKLYFDAGIAFLLSAGPVLAVVYAAAFAANVAQVGFQFSTEPLAFKPDRLNPISGFKRLFSMKNLFNLAKSLVKVLIVGAIAYVYVSGKLADLTLLMGADIAVIIRKGLEMIFDLAFRICAAILILAFIDYGYQWWQYEKELKMTKQEVKEEYKQMEGDPKVKSKIKEKQRRLSMQRMMNDVPKADVVITNPTHFAVAVRYDLTVADAPIVIAKGQDYIAFRIRQVARENGVEIVENRPLARALYDAVEVGGRIPVELYQAVAEVLAFVYNLKNKKIV